MTITERFWTKVDILENASACWLWTGCTDRKGYGRFNVDQIPVPAHRIAYELSVGKPPPGMCVLHHCDNPPCMNPAHLFIGTVADNNRDMFQKHRAWTQNAVRPSTCLRGHEKNGRSECRICKRVAGAASKMKRKPRHLLIDGSIACKWTGALVTVASREEVTCGRCKRSVAWKLGEETEAR